MDKFRYYVHNPLTGAIRACVTIIKKAPLDYTRVIALVNPKMKLARNKSIKKEISKYSDELIEKHITGENPTDLAESDNKINDRIWCDFVESWIWSYGSINMPEGYRIQNNVKLCNHEYRMIINPNGRD